MTPEEIKKMIATAQDAVSHIDDGDLKARTYEIVLNNLMRGSPQSPTPEGVHRTPQHSVEPSPNKPASPSDSNPVAILASKFDVEEALVEDYVEFNDDGHPDFLLSIDRSKASEEQVAFTVLTLTIMKIVNDEREIDSSTLREMVKNRGIKSLVNLSTNLNNYAHLIRHKKAKKGSTNTSYLLTTKGLRQGTQILKKTIQGEDFSILLDELFGSVALSKNGKKRTKKSKKQSTLTPELVKMVESGFFDTPIPVNDAVKELNRRGYFNARQDIDAAIRKELMQNQGLLTRHKKDGVWHYVKKK